MANTDENRGIDPRSIKIDKGPVAEASLAEQINFKSAAIDLFQRGLAVIPLSPHEKKTAVKWDEWLDGLSEEQIAAHWTKHPEHEVGCIVGDGMLVLDADTPESKAALAQIEEAFDLRPDWVHTTRKGEHHFYRRAPGTYAKNDGHNSTEHPARIDVKTGRGMVVLPPSTGKAVELREVEHAAELTVVGQDFIDAVFRHNGRTIPRPAPERTNDPIDDGDLLCQQRDLALLLDQIDPECGYSDWCTVGMALNHTFGGDARGLELFDRWSAKGAKYPGHAEIAGKWKSFGGFAGAPVTIGSVCKIARDQGVQLESIVGSSWEDFTAAATVTIVKPTLDTRPVLALPKKPTPVFRDFSLTGYSKELAKEILEETFVLAPLALRGQATVWYAAPNAGKTLIALNRLICAIKDGSVKPEHVFYINADDTSQGLLLKVKLAERYGFSMLAPGHREFDLKKFLGMLRQTCVDGTAPQIVLTVDTLKKTTDLMDKQRASGFTRVVREFVSHGGTFLGLAHVNKNPGPNGRPVYAGTTDIKDDFDCAYVIDVIDNGRESGMRVVEFTNEKRRGTVADTARFRYRAGNGVSYEAMLESVEIVEATEADQGIPLTQEEIDAEAISVVEHSIRAGDCKKTELLAALRQHAGLSKRNGEALLVRYTGHVPTLSKWNYEVRDHGAHCYYLLNDLLEAPNDADSGNEPQLIDVQLIPVLDF